MAFTTCKAEGKVRMSSEPACGGILGSLTAPLCETAATRGAASGDGVGDLAVGITWLVTMPDTVDWAAENGMMDVVTVITRGDEDAAVVINDNMEAAVVFTATDARIDDAAVTSGPYPEVRIAGLADVDSNMAVVVCDRLP